MCHVVFWKFTHACMACLRLGRLLLFDILYNDQCSHHNSAFLWNLRYLLHEFSDSLITQIIYGRYRKCMFSHILSERLSNWKSVNTYSIEKIAIHILLHVSMIFNAVNGVSTGTIKVWIVDGTKSALVSHYLKPDVISGRMCFVASS